MQTTAVRKAITVTLALLFGLATASASAAQGNGGVLSSEAMPHGYSLTDMAREVAAFQLSEYDASLLPDTPFEVLHLDGSTLAIDVEGGGLLGTATNTFTVEAGTPFYVPLFSLNDAFHVLGVYPTTPEEAVSYFFDQSQHGGQDFEIIVDGKSTPIGPEYLAGPVSAELDGDDAQVIVLGAFLHPLPPGTHTVVVKGGIYGDLWFEDTGFEYLREELTYTVNVVSPS